MLAGEIVNRLSMPIFVLMLDTTSVASGSHFEIAISIESVLEVDRDKKRTYCIAK